MSHIILTKEMTVIAYLSELIKDINNGKEMPVAIMETAKKIDNIYTKEETPTQHTGQRCFNCNKVLTHAESESGNYCDMCWIKS